MPRLDIGGTQIDISDDFLKMSPQAQDAFVKNTILPSPEFQAAKQKGAAPPPPAPGGFWSEMGKAVTDIPREIGRSASEGIEKIEALKDRGTQGPLEGLMTTGGAVLGAAEVPLSLLTGPARSVLGHGMTALEHLAGTVINPQVAARDDLAKMYEASRGDVDKALTAARPAGMPVRMPLVPRGPAPTTALGGPRYPNITIRPGEPPTIAHEPIGELPQSRQAYEWAEPPQAPPPAAPVAPQGTAVEEAARRAGIEVPRVLTSDNRLIQQAGQILSKQPLTGGGLGRAIENVPVQLGEARNLAAEQFGGFRTPGNVASDIGRTVGGAAETEAQAAQLAARQADEAARSNWQRANQAREQAIGGYEQQSARETGARVGEVAPTDMGETIVETVRSNEQAARARKNALYEDAGSRDASILDRAVGGAHRQIGGELAGNITLNPRLTPAAWEMRRSLRNFSNAAQQRVAQALDIGEGEQTGLGLRAVEQQRKELNNIARSAANDEDARAARATIDAFDEWQHRSMRGALMEGSDPEALSAYERARAANRDWRQRFGYNDRNDADKVINKMVRGEPGQHIGPNDVSNILTATRGDKTERLLDRIYEATGDHPGHQNVVQAVRGGMWNKLAGAAEGVTGRTPEKTASDIYQFLHGTGRNMAGRIYSAEDQALMRRHADVLRAGQRAREDTAALAKTSEPQPTEVTRGPMEELAQRVLGRGQKSDEALYNTIEGLAKSKSRADLKTLADLMRSLPEELKGNFLNSFIRRLGTGQKDAFSPAIFEKEWNAISPQTKAVLTGNSGPHVAALDDIATISRHYDQVHRRFGNPSGSGHVINFAHGLGAVVTGMLSGALLGPLSTVGLWLGGVGVSKFLSTPAGAASLARFAKQMERLQAAPTLANAAAARLATRNMRNTAIALGIDATNIPAGQK